MNREIKATPTKSERREKKKLPRMHKSGRGVFAIQRLKQKTVKPLLRNPYEVEPHKR